MSNTVRLAQALHLTICDRLGLVGKVGFAGGCQSGDGASNLLGVDGAQIAVNRSCQSLIIECLNLRTIASQRRD